MSPIWKHELTALSGSLYLPKGSKILSFMAQRMAFVVYVLQGDNDGEREEFRYKLILTGGSMDMTLGYRFIGTAMRDDGFVAHCFVKDNA